VAYVEGDIGDSKAYANMVVVQQIIGAAAPYMVLALGDLTYGNAHGQAAVDQHFNDVMVWSQNTAYMPAWGNHEWDSSGDDLRNYKGRFDLVNRQTSPGSPSVSCCGEDWFWFDYGNVRFITYPEPWSGAWADWNTKAGAIMDQAQADANIDFIVTYGHRPAYSSGHHPGDSTLKNIIDGLGARHSKYVLNLNGHSHDYERSFPQSGVTHITAGTGGASLEEDGSCLWLTCTQPSWSAFRAMHLGPVRLTFGPTWIEVAYICGPPGGGTNDITCTQGSVVDSVTILAAGGGGDTTPPTAPAGLTASAISSSRIDLSWSASTDNVGVTGYQVFRGSTLVTTVSGTTYSDTGLSAGTSYTYTVRARDAAGNVSPASSPATATTLAPATLSFQANADATIRQNNPTRNLGGLSKLETDANPAEEILIRFTVSGLGSTPMSKAVLRLATVRSASSGGSVFRSPSTWTESTVTWNNAPAADPSPLATIGAVTAGTNADVDVSSLITGDGTYSVRVRTTSAMAAAYRSREGGTAPMLLVTTNP
jgi:hypothetical protein